MAQMWEVVGGSRIGGLIVWEGKSMKSAVLRGRLSCGSLLREEALEDGRLCFSKVTGAGPEEGWVSLKVAQEELVKRTAKSGMEVVKVFTEAELEAAGKRRATAGIYYESSDSEPEAASSEPTVMLAIEDGSVESFQSVPTIGYILAEMEREERREEWELKEQNPPSLEEILAGIDNDERRDADGEVAWQSFQELGRGDGTEEDEGQSGPSPTAEVDWTAVLSEGTNRFGVGLRAPDEAVLSAMEEKRRRLHETAQNKRLAGQRKRQEFAQKAMTQQQASRNISLSDPGQGAGAVGGAMSRFGGAGSALGNRSEAAPKAAPQKREAPAPKDFGKEMKRGFLNSKPKQLPPGVGTPPVAVKIPAKPKGHSDESVLSLEEMLAQLDRDAVA